MQAVTETSENRDSAEVKPGTSLVELTFVLAIWVFFCFRLMALPFLAVALWCSRPGANLAVRITSRMMLALSLILPFDVQFADISRSHHGDSQSHIRVVPYVIGMPAHTRLIEEHGEYYSESGFGSSCLYPPRSIVSISFTAGAP